MISLSAQQHIINQKKKTVLNRIDQDHPLLSEWIKTESIIIDQTYAYHASASLWPILQASNNIEIARAHLETPNSNNLTSFSFISHKIDANLLKTISQEEKDMVFSKMRSLLDHNTHDKDEETLYYLEQQLSDITGISLTRNLDGIDLPHSLGKIWAGRHLKRFAKDSLENHDEFPEALIDHKRPFFGWMLEQGALTTQAIMQEKYYLGLQLFQTQDWHLNHQDLTLWFHHRKIMIINPFSQKACLCSVENLVSSDQYNYQFSGSPEVIRTIQAWDSNSRGKIMAFFVQDNSTHLGEVILE